MSSDLVRYKVSGSIAEVLIEAGLGRDAIDDLVKSGVVREVKEARHELRSGSLHGLGRYRRTDA